MKDLSVQARGKLFMLLVLYYARKEEGRKIVKNSVFSQFCIVGLVIAILLLK